MSLQTNRSLDNTFASQYNQGDASADSFKAAEGQLNAFFWWFRGWIDDKDRSDELRSEASNKITYWFGRDEEGNPAAAEDCTFEWNQNNCFYFCWRYCLLYYWVCDWMTLRPFAPFSGKQTKREGSNWKWWFATESRWTHRDCMGDFCAKAPISIAHSPFYPCSQVPFLGGTT